MNFGTFNDKNLGKNAFYQMNISDNFKFSSSKSPQPDEIQNSFAGLIYQVVPSDFQIFIGVYDPSQYKFSILSLDKMTFQFKSWPVIPNIFSKKQPVIVQDSQSKTLFFTTNDETTCTLHAVDTMSGAYQKAFITGSSLSRPFLTMPLDNASATNTSKAQSKVLVLDSLGNLRAFQRDLTKNYLAINPYIFNNGKDYLNPFSSIFSIPPESVFYPSLVSQSGNFLRVLSSSDSAQNFFPVNLNW